MKEEMKAAQSEIKENIQETNSEGKETSKSMEGLKSMTWNKRKKYAPNWNRIKKQESKKKMKRGLGTSGTTLNIVTSES